MLTCALPRLDLKHGEHTHVRSPPKEDGGRPGRQCAQDPPPREFGGTTFVLLMPGPPVTYPSHIIPWQPVTVALTSTHFSIASVLRLLL